MAQPIPTRQRLLTEGLRLFADRGFRATSVGDIEAAAGLQPRRGALYKHFESKQALLEAALRAHLDDTATGAAQLSGLDLAGAIGDDRELVHEFLISLGRWFLDEMDRQRALTHLVEHEGRHLAGLRAEVKDHIIDVAHRAAAEFIAASLPRATDPEATAVLLLGSLVALRRTAWTFGAAPLDVDDGRALAAWAELALGVFDAYAADRLI